MALELKSSSRWWYGRFLINGSLRRVNLGVKVDGVRPASIKQSGDAAFERSRGKAEARHADTLREIHSKKTSEELAQRVLEIKVGNRYETLKLENVADAWMNLARKRVPTKEHQLATRNRLQKFIDYMARNHRDVADLASVQSTHVRMFLAEQESLGISARTWNRLLSLLKGVFRVFEPGADAYRSYLQRTPQRVEETVHRQPFTAEELSIVLDAAESDVLIRKLAVTAICTAMRRGDCARLKWSSVDLKSGFVTVKTGKTGERVEIPILPPLKSVFDSIPPKAENDSWVFPDAAELYAKNPAQLDRRLKSVLAKAGFVTDAVAKRAQRRSERKIRPELPVLPADEVARRGFEAIEKKPMSSARRETMRAVFRSYMAGQGLPSVARHLEISKSTASLHLREIERAIGAAVVRWQEPETPRIVRGRIMAENGSSPRLKRGTLKGWHSFRTTFCTLALSAGMPMELVQRVTGHKTAEVVLKHYFKPGREQFREAMLKAMPKMLTEGHMTPKEEMRRILEAMTAENWAPSKSKLLEVLRRES